MKFSLPQLDMCPQPDEQGRPSVIDPLRCRRVVLTPEEEVRQRFVAYLVCCKGYPPAWMANEVSLRLNGMSRRCDTVVFDRERRPLVIVEYKSPSVTITQRVFDQIVRYNMALRARWLIVSNGMEHYCCRVDYDSNRCEMVAEIPSFEEL